MELLADRRPKWSDHTVNIAVRGVNYLKKWMFASQYFFSQKRLCSWIGKELTKQVQILAIKTKADLNRRKTNIAC